jgi:hypothetical protein
MASNTSSLREAHQPQQVLVVEVVVVALAAQRQQLLHPRQGHLPRERLPCLQHQERPPQRRRLVAVVDVVALAVVAAAAVQQQRLRVRHNLQNCCS